MHTHTECKSFSLSNFKRNRNAHPEKKTKFADELEKLFEEFLARFKDFKSYDGSMVEWLECRDCD